MFFTIPFTQQLRRISKVGLLLAFGLRLMQGEVLDVAGQWRVVRSPTAGSPSSTAQEWVRALPGALYTLRETAMPSIAMVRKDLGYTYSFSSPTVGIFLEGVLNPSPSVGFLQLRSERKFEGELFSGGCWTHLSLVESEDGATLTGSARINTKISKRQCLRGLIKEFRNGAPFDYALTRVR